MKMEIPVVTDTPGVVRELHVAPEQTVQEGDLIAVVDTLGYVAFNFGVRHADTTVVATAAAPYAVVPIVFGVMLLHERPRWAQWAGIGLVIGGLILLGLFA